MDDDHQRTSTVRPSDTPQASSSSNSSSNLGPSALSGIGTNSSISRERIASMPEYTSAVRYLRNIGFLASSRSPAAPADVAAAPSPAAPADASATLSPAAPTDVNTAPSPGVVQDAQVRNPPAPRSAIRRRAYADSDGESIASMPSLRTVSGSSDDEWIDESEDDDDDSGDDHEDDDDEDDHDDDDPEARQEGNFPPFYSRMVADAFRASSTTRMVDPRAFPDQLSPGLEELLGPPGSDPLAVGVELFRQAIGQLRMPESEGLGVDNKRAEMIIKELEVVPEDLAHRYEKLRSGLDDEPCEGCAICRDSFVKPDPVDPEPVDTSVSVYLAALPFPNGPGEDGFPSFSSILAFPCPGMHLFHSGCLSPWLGRKTTCPTCRYDIDPQSLTLSFLRDYRLRTDNPLAIKQWRPPKGRSFERWLTKQERKLQPGYVSDADSEPDGSEDVNDEPTVPLRGILPSSTTTTPNRQPSGIDPPPIPTARQTTGPNLFTNAIRPTTQQAMMAALLPIIDMMTGPEEDDYLGEEDYITDEEDEDEEDIPDLIPVARPAARALRPTPQFYQQGGDDDEDDDELPDLVNEPPTNSRREAAPTFASRGPLPFWLAARQEDVPAAHDPVPTPLDEEDEDELPGLEPASISDVD